MRTAPGHIWRRRKGRRCEACVHHQSHRRKTGLHRADGADGQGPGCPTRPGRGVHPDQKPRPRRRHCPEAGGDRAGAAVLRLRRRRHGQRGGQRRRRGGQCRHDLRAGGDGERFFEEFRGDGPPLLRPGEPVGRPPVPPGRH